MVSVGENKYNLKNTKTTHAEEDAIENLESKSKKNLENVNLVVIKTTKTGVLGNSYPCIHCLHAMVEKTYIKGYKINKIYFSNSEGEIECHKLIDILYSRYQHVSSYYSITNYNIEKWYKWRSQSTVLKKRIQFS